MHTKLSWRDVPKVLALMDDKIEWTEAEGFPLHRTYVGPQAVVDGVFMRLGEIGDDFTVTPTRFVAEDDTVVVTGTDRWGATLDGQASRGADGARLDVS